MKRYKDFLNENVNEYDNLKKEIMEVLNIYRCNFKNYRFIRNGEDEFKECLDEFEENSINIDYFMKKYIKKIVKDDDFTSHGAVTDMLLYKYDKNHPLSGNLLQDDMDSWDDTATIKYNYGYHIVKLGTKYLLQTYNNLNEFYEQCAKEYATYFLEYRLPNNVLKYDYSQDIVDKYSSYINEGDIYLVNINFEGLHKDGHIENNLKSLKSVIEKGLKDSKSTFYFDGNNNINDIIGDLTDTSNKLLQKYKEEYEFFTGIQKYNLV